MKNAHWLLVSLTVLTLSSTAVCNAVATNNAFLIVPGKSVGKITLGMPVAEAKKILGNPSHDEDGVLEFYKKDMTLLVDDGKVSEIIFESDKFSTQDGLSLSNYEQPSNYKAFQHWKLPWRFMNLKHTLQTGGLNIFATNIDSGNDDYVPRTYGVVFAGPHSEAGLAIADEPNDGWESWDGDADNLWKGATLQDGLFTTKVRSPGTVGKE